MLKLYKKYKKLYDVTFEYCKVQKFGEKIDLSCKQKFKFTKSPSKWQKELQNLLCYNLLKRRSKYLTTLQKTINRIK